MNIELLGVGCTSLKGRARMNTIKQNVSRDDPNILPCSQNIEKRGLPSTAGALETSQREYRLKFQREMDLPSRL